MRSNEFQGVGYLFGSLGSTGKTTVAKNVSAYDDWDHFLATAIFPWFNSSVPESTSTYNKYAVAANCPWMINEKVISFIQDSNETWIPLKGCMLVKMIENDHDQLPGFVCVNSETIRDVAFEWSEMKKGCCVWVVCAQTGVRLLASLSIIEAEDQNYVRIIQSSFSVLNLDRYRFHLLPYIEIEGRSSVPKQFSCVLKPENQLTIHNLLMNAWRKKAMVYIDKMIANSVALDENENDALTSMIRRFGSVLENDASVLTEILNGLMSNIVTSSTVELEVEILSDVLNMLWGTSRLRKFDEPVYYPAKNCGILEWLCATTDSWPRMVKDEKNNEVLFFDKKGNVSADGIEAKGGEALFSTSFPFHMCDDACVCFAIARAKKLNKPHLRKKLLQLVIAYRIQIYAQEHLKRKPLTEKVISIEGSKTSPDTFEFYEKDGSKSAVTMLPVDMITTRIGGFFWLDSATPIALSLGGRALEKGVSAELIRWRARNIYGGGILTYAPSVIANPLLAAVSETSRHRWFDESLFNGRVVFSFVPDSGESAVKLMAEELKLLTNASQVVNVTDFSTTVPSTRNEAAIWPSTKRPQKQINAIWITARNSTLGRTEATLLACRTEEGVLVNVDNLFEEKLTIVNDFAIGEA